MVAATQPSIRCGVGCTMIVERDSCDSFTDKDTSTWKCCKVRISDPVRSVPSPTDTAPTMLYVSCPSFVAISWLLVPPTVTSIAGDCSAPSRSSPTMLRYRPISTTSPSSCGSEFFRWYLDRHDPPVKLWMLTLGITRAKNGRKAGMQLQMTPMLISIILPCLSVHHSNAARTRGRENLHIKYLASAEFSRTM